MTTTALVPYDLDFAARRDEQTGYNNYSMTESSYGEQQNNYAMTASPQNTYADSDYTNYSVSSPTAMVPCINNNEAINPKHPRKKQMKNQRRRRTAGGAVGGAVVGGLVLGPVGAVFGGVGGAAVTRKICRTGEKRAQRRFEHKVFQKNTLEAGMQSTGSFA